MAPEMKTLPDLQPAPHWRHMQLPVTTLPVPPTDCVHGLTTDRSVKRLDIGRLKHLHHECGIDSLIQNYTRAIMAVTGQNHIAFWITVDDEGSTAKRGVVIAKCATDDTMPQWEAFEATLEDYTERSGTMEFGLWIMRAGEIDIDPESSVRFALYVNLESSWAEFKYPADLQCGADITSIVRQLEVYLECIEGEGDSTQFWSKELQDFVTIPERQFPTLSCERVTVTSATLPILSQSLAMGTTWEELESLAQRLQLQSTASVVRAAFAYILAEYLESDKVLIGERVSVDVEPTQPDTAVPVPIFVTQPTAEDLIRQIDNSIARIARVQTISPDRLLEILNCPSSPVPYNAFFTYHQAMGPGEKAEDDDTRSEFSMASIGLCLEHSQQGIPSCTLSARRDLMDVSHLELVLRQIDSLVTAILARPTESLQDLTQTLPEDLLSSHSPLVSEELRQAPHLSPSHWVDHWAASNPTWVALEVIEAISDDSVLSKRWTYRELTETSDRLCTWLAHQGWCNRVIAVCLGRSFIAYALVLAIWKSGNCYVPIAEDLPEARQVFLLSDSGATALFAEKDTATSLIPPDDCRVIDINDHQFLEELDTAEELTVTTANPTDNCYLLYTSGSTGMPKGVLVSRGNLSAFTEAQSEYICRDVPDTLELQGKGGYLAHASRAFDVHICEMVLGWRHGLRLVTAPRTMILDNLLQVLRRLRITHAGFVPSLLEHTGVSAEQLPDLRYLGVGGEKISETIIERFVGKPRIALVNAYGPTEVTIGMSSHTVTATSTVRNIGTAVGNITIHVFEPETTKYVKRGQAGELCVTGDLVANGYHCRPDAQGFTDYRGQRMYRTGDIVRLMANNCIEYLGRRDSQAKVRGQRLELEEVSLAVRRCADRPVNVTSMVTPSPITKRPQLVAFISPSRDRPDDLKTQPAFLKAEYQAWVPGILERCREELPVYMVPSVLLPVSFIPIQISGKADNRRLVALYEKIPASDLHLQTRMSAARAPEPDLHAVSTSLTTDEEKIRDILCSVVSVDRSTVMKTTSIFQLGIDSLSSLSVAAKMREAGYQCAAADILGNPTLAQLASLPLSRADGGLQSSKYLWTSQLAEASRRLECLDQSFRQLQNNIPNSSIAVVRPCLPLQESLVSSSMGSLTPLYVNHIMCRIGSDIVLGDLRLAFEDLIHENEILRTCFRVMDDKVVQVVLKPRVAKISWEQVAVADEEAAQVYFRNRQTEVAIKIVRNIESEAPLHIVAASSSNNALPGWLMLSIHHSIFDGASMGVLLDRLHHHYTGKTAMHTRDLTPLYRHFVTPPQEAAERFWSSYLTGARPSIVEADSPSNASYEIITEELPFKLSMISKVASKISTTTPIILETLWGISLARYLVETDVIFGRIMNGRSIPVESVEEMLIPLVTTVPSRLRLPSGSSSLVDLIKAHTQASLASLPYQHTALRDIQRYAQAPGPLFNSMFSYIATAPTSPATAMLVEMDSVMPADYPLALEIKAESESDKVTLRLRVTRGSCLKDSARGLIDVMCIILQGLISNGDVVIENEGRSQTQERQEPKWDESRWTEWETKLREVVSEITGLPESQISKNISFLALGVDSVITIRMARRLQEQGLKASSSDIMRYPSIGALHNYLQKSNAVPSISPVKENISDPSICIDLFHEDDSIVETYRCTPLQTAMIGQCLSSEGKAYVHHHAVILDGSVDLEQLASAWQEVVGLADILRTTFHRKEASHDFQAAVHQHSLVQWFHQPAVESLSEAIEEISQRVAYPDIKSFQRPPWQVTILTGISQRLMVVTMHHCLYDGFSLPLLFDCVDNAYRGLSNHVDSFASAARKVTSTEESSVKFWADTVKGYRYCKVPLPPTAAIEPCVQSAEATVRIPVTTLQHQCRCLEVTLQTVALLAFGRSLATLMGQRDVIFGHVVSGRGQGIDGTGSIIGPLFNTVPFRLVLDPILQSTRSVLRHIQRFSADAQSHQHAPLSLIQKGWRLDSHSEASSLFETLFTFNKSGNQDTASVFQPYLAERAPDTPHYRLNVEFEQRPDFLVVRASSRDLLSNGDELDAWLQTLALGLEKIISHPDAPVLSFPPELRALPLATGSIQDVGKRPTDIRGLENHARIIKRIIGTVTQTPIDQIHEDSSIFALGVDSILAIDISAKSRGAGLKLSVSDILQGRTVQGIAMIAANKIKTPSVLPETITDGRSTISADAKQQALTALSLGEDEVEVVLPCLSGQMFYISSWLDSGRRLWEFTFAFTSRVRLDPGQLDHAWLFLQRRHSILRTSFAAVSAEEIVQVVCKPSKVNRGLRVESQPSTGDLQSTIQGLTRDIACSPSDLFMPPVRLCLVQHKDSDALLLTIHHALYDAWTIPMLIGDLEALYLSNSLPPHSSFPAFVHHAQQTAGSTLADAYWKPALGAGQRTVLGRNTPSAANPSQLLSSQLIYPQELKIVEARCHQLGVSVACLVLLAVGRSLARTADVTHPTFGLFQSGRSSEYPEIHRVAGPTVNMLPFVIPDALTRPMVGALEAIQHDLGQRAIHDQTNLRQLRQRMKELGNDLEFNVLLNIVFSKSTDNSTRDATDPLFTPSPIGFENYLSVEQPLAGATSVDKFRCDWLPCEKNIYLEVNYNETDGELHWKVDYAVDSMTTLEAQTLLENIGQEMNLIMGDS
ncbi:nonribosomal peptide synthase [Aspergillus bombycis]|uniref:Nonribosomal peptide synthase n=1 Tax=Aspergillus bombycis TaxID=109264 RepID=A0A1F8AFQ6_9EURO|nr:nonribosomal peptide synthase [Aspergillus bombycis]OGM50128.1 nonribosomal peptide synthase [Aspergillus bombycis]